MTPALDLRGTAAAFLSSEQGVTYASWRDHHYVEVSLDGGATWASLDKTPFLQGPGSHDGDQGVRVYVSCLACDPATPGRIYAGLREEGYDVNNGRGVFVSDDWAVTWRPFSLKGLTKYSIGTLVIDPVRPARLYAGTGGNGFFCFGATRR